MALIVADRVKQESTTTGTGTFTLSGGVDGFQNFSAVCSTNDTMYYCIQDKVGTDFEIGHGTFNGSGQLERTNVLQSSTNFTKYFSLLLKLKSKVFDDLKYILILSISV